MKQEIRQNFENKLQLVLADLLKSLDDEMETMRILHANKGILKSGNTINKTMHKDTGSRNSKAAKLLKNFYIRP